MLYLGMKEYPSAYTTPLRSPDDLPPFWRVDLNITKKISERVDLDLNIRNLCDRTNYMPSMWGMKNGIEEPGISVLDDDICFLAKPFSINEMARKVREILDN